MEEGLHPEVLLVLNSHCYPLLTTPRPFLSVYLSLWSNQNILSPFATKWITECCRYFPGEKVREGCVKNARNRTYLALDPP